MSQVSPHLQEKKDCHSSDKGNTPDVQTMKKSILAEISDVTEEDLNVMSYKQILTFYNELVGACGTQNLVQEVNSQVTVAKQGEKNLQNFQKVNAAATNSLPIKENIQSKNLVDAQNISQSQSKSVQVNGVMYQTPKSLQQSTYVLGNKRFQIICNPEIKNSEEKRKAVSQSYNSGMTQAIKSMKDQQIQEIYLRLRQVNLKQGILNTKNLKLEKQIPIKKICLYIPKQKVTQNIIFYGLQKDDNRTTKQQKQSNSLNFKQKKQPEKQQQKEENNQINIQDGFFDEFVNCEPLLQDRGSVQKIGTKVEPKNQASLRDRLKSLKQKDIKQTSMQTQSFQAKPPKTKTKITIFNQVQYIQQQLNQKQAQQRCSPLSRDIEGQPKLPYKVMPSKLQQALINPGSKPQPQILKWIQNMKQTVRKFEIEYLNQFGSNQESKIDK